MYLWLEVPGGRELGGVRGRGCSSTASLVAPGSYLGPSGEGYVADRARPDRRGVRGARPRSWRRCCEPRARVEEIVAALDRGERRVASRVDGEWVVDVEAKEAILEYFRLRKVEPIEVGPFEYHDKIPLKRDYAGPACASCRPASARYGSFLSEGVVLMPSYVNIGAWVGPRTMVDTWATVGSCAQIGADVHLVGRRRHRRRARAGAGAAR